MNSFLIITILAFLAVSINARYAYLRNPQEISNFLKLIKGNLPVHDQEVSQIELPSKRGGSTTYHQRVLVPHQDGSFDSPLELMMGMSL